MRAPDRLVTAEFVVADPLHASQRAVELRSREIWLMAKRRKVENLVLETNDTSKNLVNPVKQRNMKTTRINHRAAALLLMVAALAVSALNGQCANPAYPGVVKGDGALAYYRFNDSTTRDTINVNIGSLGAAGNATNDLSGFGVVHSISGAIVGDPDHASFYDFTTRTEIPFNAALNTPNTQAFTVEAWMYPVNDQDTTSFGGMGALCNRWTASGNRQGWVMYERRPNLNYDIPKEGVGWEFRMYNDLDGSQHLDH